MADILLDNILHKINNRTITCEDIDFLINDTKMLYESMPESVRDRVRRRSLRNATKSHIDDEGHQPLKDPSLTKRVQPKRKPVNQQSHGKARLAHKHSARTQSRLYEATGYIISKMGQPLTEAFVTKYNSDIISQVARKLLLKKNVNREWLYELLNKVDRHGQENR